MRPFVLIAMLVSLSFSLGQSAMGATKVSIQDACAVCAAGGNKPAKKPIQSALKKEI